MAEIRDRVREEIAVEIAKLPHQAIDNQYLGRIWVVAESDMADWVKEGK